MKVVPQVWIPVRALLNLTARDPTQLGPLELEQARILLQKIVLIFWAVIKCFLNRFWSHG